MEKFTKEDAKRQGPALYLCLKGKAREAVRSIDVEVIADNDSVDVILKALDDVFLQDETTRGWIAPILYNVPSVTMNFNMSKTFEF